AGDEALAQRVDRGDVNEQRREKNERDRVGQINAFVELRPHFQGRAEEMRDEGEQADDKEVCDVRSAPLFEQEIEADTQVNQPDQRKIQTLHHVRIAHLQCIQVGDPFARHVAALVAPFQQVTEDQRIAEAELAFRLIEVNLDVRGPSYLIKRLASGSADVQQHIAAINAGE